MKNSLKKHLSTEVIDTDGVMTEVLDNVDTATPGAGAEINTTADEIDNVGSDIETAQGYVDALEQSPPEGASDDALAMAQVGLEAIFNKYSIPVKKRVVARESADYSNKLATFQTIEMANEGIGEMLKSFGESCKNVIDRMRVNMKDTFRRRAAWLKEANALRAQLQKASGSPDPAAKYTNRIRVAHMTKGDQTVVTTGKEMLVAVDSVDAAMHGLVGFLEGIGSLFTWFNNQKGKMDFGACTANFEPSVFSKNMLSLSGTAAMFGEETIINKLSGSSDNPEEMMKIAAGIDINHTHVWKVKDLQQPELAPLSIAEMNSGIQDLITVGQTICDLYNRYDQDVVKWIQEMNRKAQAKYDIDMITSPIRWVRFNRIYTRVMWACIASIQNGFDLNFKAATCLLEYWKWSVANNK